jgi:hypothetical protein
MNTFFNHHEAESTAFPLENDGNAHFDSSPAFPRSIRCRSPQHPSRADLLSRAPISLSSRQTAIFLRQTTNPPSSSGQSTAPPTNAFRHRTNEWWDGGTAGPWRTILSGGGGRHWRGAAPPTEGERCVVAATVDLWLIASAGSESIWHRQRRH